MYQIYNLYGKLTSTRIDNKVARIPKSIMSCRSFSSGRTLCQRQFWMGEIVVGEIVANLTREVD